MHAASRVPQVGAVFRPQLPPERLHEYVVSAAAAGLDDVWLWEDCFAEGGLARVIRTFADAGATAVVLQPTADDPDVTATMLLAAEARALLRNGSSRSQ